MVIAVNLNADILGKERRIGSAVPTVAGFDLLNELNEHEDEVKRGTIGSLARRLFRREPTHPSLFGVMISSLCIVQARIPRPHLAGAPPEVRLPPTLRPNPQDRHDGKT